MHDKLRFCISKCKVPNLHTLTICVLRSLMSVRPYILSTYHAGQVVEIMGRVDYYKDNSSKGNICDKIFICPCLIRETKAV